MNPPDPDPFSEYATAVRGQPEHGSGSIWRQQPMGTLALPGDRTRFSGGPYRRSEVVQLLRDSSLCRAPLNLDQHSHFIEGLELLRHAHHPHQVSLRTWRPGTWAGQIMAVLTGGITDRCFCSGAVRSLGVRRSPIRHAAFIGGRPVMTLHLARGYVGPLFLLNLAFRSSPAAFYFSLPPLTPR